MIRVAIAEDDAVCAGQLRSYLEQYGKERETPLDVSLYSDGMELVEDYRPIYDILLLDIEMPRLDGMTAAQRIRRLDQDVIIIFITNMARYAIRGYEVGALDFVLKPVRYFAFALKMDKAAACLRGRAQKSLMVPTQEGMVRITTGEITYIEVVKHYLQFHTEQGRTYSMLGTLTEMEKQLADASFARCNKGYLVNLRHITQIRSGSVVVGGDELLIARRRKDEFLRAVTDYYGGGGR